MPSRSVITLGPERLVVNLFACTTGISEVDSGPDTGFTQVFDLTYLTYHDQHFIGDVQAATTAGTIGADTRSLTNNQGWACFSFALVPST